MIGEAGNPLSSGMYLAHHKSHEDWDRKAASNSKTKGAAHLPEASL